MWLFFIFISFIVIILILIGLIPKQQTEGNMKNIALLLLGYFILTTGCLKSDFDIQKRVEVLFFVENISEDLIFGSDTVNVTEFKYVLNSFRLTTQDSVVIQTDSDVNALIFSYDEAAAGDRIVISTGLGFELNDFVAYDMSLGPVEDGAPILDGDFFGGENNYSIIMKGSVNSTEFIFKSDILFNKRFDFDPVTVSDSEETIFIRSRLDVQDIFQDTEGAFLSPLGTSNKTKIEEEIEEELDIVAFKGTIFITTN